MGSFSTELLKNGGHWVSSPQNTRKMGVIGYRFAKRGSLGTDLQKRGHWYRFAKTGSLVQICKKGVNEYTEAKFAQIPIISGNSLITIAYV